MINGRTGRRFATVLATTSALLFMPPVNARAVPTSQGYSGTTADGGAWVADVPSAWNGTLVLYSHGYGPLVAADAPTAPLRVALLDLGYALVGSSYDPHGPLYALGSALADQFQALAAAEKDLPSAPKEVVAFGISMGGLVSALEDQQSNGRIDGALTACGAVAGGGPLSNYQLDGEYAIAKLLAPSEQVTLVNFTSAEGAAATGEQLGALARQAQATPAGRARLALAMALMNVPTWAYGQAMPAPGAYGAQEDQQYGVEFTGAPTVMDFFETSRAATEQAAGGNGSWTFGVDFGQLLNSSPYAPEVKALYRDAGLDLNGDLAVLTTGADIKAGAKAAEWLGAQAAPTGRLQVPELDMHTIGDQLVPVQQENYYASTVSEAGSSGMLRQAFVQRQLHCNFTLAEVVTGLLAVQHRVATGTWGRSPERRS